VGSVEFIRKDLFLCAAFRTLADKGFQLSELFEPWTVSWRGHINLPFFFGPGTRRLMDVRSLNLCRVALRNWGLSALSEPCPFTFSRASDRIPLPDIRGCSRSHSKIHIFLYTKDTCPVVCPHQRCIRNCYISRYSCIRLLLPMAIETTCRPVFDREVISKLRPRPDGCVAGFLKMLTT